MAAESKSTTLHELFNSRLTELYEVEKKCRKVYQKLAKSAYTSELQNAISPSSTEIEAHLDRMKLIMELQSIKSKQLKEEKKYPFPDIVILSTLSGRKKNIRHDADIILNVSVVQNYKIAIYDFLYRTALSMGLEQQTALLEQCITENKNTYAWLQQILTNIIYKEI